MEEEPDICGFSFFLFSCLSCQSGEVYKVRMGKDFLQQQQQKEVKVVEEEAFKSASIN